MAVKRVPKNGKLLDSTTEKSYVEEVSNVTVNSPRKIGIQKDAVPVKDSSNTFDGVDVTVIALKQGTRRAGVSKGVTINLQNYESARVTYWMERIIDDNDESYVREIAKMTDLIEDLISADIEGCKK